MRAFPIIALGFIAISNCASAQTTKSPDGATGAAGTLARDLPAEYSAPTAGQRWKLYLNSSFGPEAILTAAAAGGIELAMDSPKEWRQGGNGYSKRFGDVLGRNFVGATLEHGVAAALHEDNRYLRSMETGFWKRSEHAIVSAFLARNSAGQTHFAYSRLGGALGASFISRAWQPASTNTAGDAAVVFGYTIASQIGWNLFKEFRPLHFLRH